MKTSVTTHHYIGNGQVDTYTGQDCCAVTGCGLPKKNARHEVPEPSADETRVSLRIVGEHERSDE